MKGFFQNLSMKMARWMQGRYGVDGLSNGLMALGVITMLLSIIPHLDLLSWVAIACMAVALYRMCSKNFARRRKENETYERVMKRPKHTYALVRFVLLAAAREVLRAHAVEGHGHAGDGHP